MPAESGKSWRTFSQENFTAVALLGLLLFALVALIVLMHEDKIDDKYVTWLEGFAAGVFSTLNLALRGSNSGQHQGDTIKAGDNTVVNQAPAVPQEESK